jgi:5-formyltetrahydrofolate cyclo-ligase
MTLAEVPEKAALRRQLEELRRNLSCESQASDMIRRLTAHSIWKNASVILSYMPFRGELDITPLMEKALSEGKKFALPLTVTGASEGIMEFRLVSSESDLKIGRFGIREPQNICPTVTDIDLFRALCIVPGIAFDKDGYRLGYGGGYYDRFLENFKGVSVGLVTSRLLCSTPLPRDGHDMAVDYVITERQVLCTRGKKE